MKRCSQCKTSPRTEGGPKLVRSQIVGVGVQVRCSCGLHTGWCADELKAQAEWKDDANLTGWSK